MKEQEAAMSNVRFLRKPINSLANRVAAELRDWKKLGRRAVGRQAEERAREALEKATWRRNQPRE